MTSETRASRSRASFRTSSSSASSPSRRRARSGSFGLLSDEPVRDVMGRWNALPRTLSSGGRDRFATADAGSRDARHPAPRRAGMAGFAATPPTATSSIERGTGAGRHGRRLRAGVHRASRRARSRCCTRAGAARRRASSSAGIAVLRQHGLRAARAARAPRTGDLRHVLRGERRRLRAAHRRPTRASRRRSTCARSSPITHARQGVRHDHDEPALHALRQRSLLTRIARATSAASSG